jgi:hypothetical protein
MAELPKLAPRSPFAGFVWSMLVSSFAITTSWDDGHILDLRIADLLIKYNLTGTFYIAKNYLPTRLSETEIARFSQQHEIGSHTLTHPDLTSIPLDQVRSELKDSKAWLEGVIQKPVTAFCYPRGQFNPEIQRAVAEAGYTMARTVTQYQMGSPKNLMAMDTTIHIYPFPFRPVDGIKARFDPIRYILPEISHLHIPIMALRSWVTLASVLLDKASEIGGVWHLWGHSWEIERYGMWDALEHVLALTTKYPTAQKITNTELAQNMLTSRYM